MSKIILTFVVQNKRDMKLFTDKKFHTDTNNWYAPLCEFWGQHKSVHTAEYMDKTSSAGDWSGYILQRIGNNVYAIGFSQENCWRGNGFNLYTCEHPFYKGRVDEVNLLENVRSCWEQFAGLE